MRRRRKNPIVLADDDTPALPKQRRKKKQLSAPPKQRPRGKRTYSILDVHICTCGLISANKNQVVSSHSYHAKTCVKFNQSTLPPQNTRLHTLETVLKAHQNTKTLTKTVTRQHEWQPILDSVFMWVRSWFAQSTMSVWSLEDFP